jgi:hypothetical protein
MRCSLETRQVPTSFSSLGIEYLNHEVSSQIIATSHSYFHRSMVAFTPSKSLGYDCQFVFITATAMSLWSQESFEELPFNQVSKASAKARSNSVGLPETISIQSSTNSALYIRHCDYILWTTEQV